MKACRLLVGLIIALALPGMLPAAAEGASAPTDAKLLAGIERPLLPLPPTVFWRHALLTAQPLAVAAETAARAAAAKKSADPGAEARWLTAGATALLGLPGADDATLSRAWQLAVGVSDAGTTADAHLQLGLRAYMAADLLAAATHADASLRAARDARDSSRLLASHALQRLIELPLVGDSSLLTGDLFSAAQMRQIAQSMMGWMSGGKKGEQASRAPLRERLLSRQVTATGSALATTGLPREGLKWAGLIDGYQAYAEGDAALADELWRAQAGEAPGQGDERVRGLAWLGVAWLQMVALSEREDDVGGEDKHKAKRDKAAQDKASAARATLLAQGRASLQQARAAFARAGVRSGMGQALMLLAELDYMAGRVDDARTAAAEARRIYAELGRDDAVMQQRLTSARGERLTGQAAPAALETEAGEALLQRSVSLPERVSAYVVAGLTEHARVVAMRSRKDATRAPEEAVAGARAFLRWARGTGEPIAQLLALDGLSKALAAAGYMEDATFYRLLKARGHAAYQAAMPLEARLRRAALLDYDLLVADGGANLGQVGEIKTSTFERVEKALMALLDVEYVIASDPRFADAIGMSDATRNDLLKRQKASVERLLKGQRSAGEAFNAALASGDRRAAARQYIEFTRWAEALRKEMEGVRALNRSLDDKFTHQGRGTRTEGRVVANYRVVLPTVSETESLHASTFAAYERDVMVAGLLAEPQRALDAASELASFYTLYREALKPAAAADFPTMLAAGSLDIVDESHRTVPTDDKQREKLLNQGIDEYQKAYIDRLVLRAIGEENDPMTGMGLFASEGARFLRANFDDRRGITVQRNEVRKLGTGPSGRVDFEIDHAYTHRLELRPKAPIMVRPQPERSLDLPERLQRLAGGSDLARRSSPLNWTALVSELSTLDVVDAYAQKVLGVSLAAAQERTSVFASLLTPAVIALSRTRVDDLTLPAGMLDYATAAAAVRRHPQLAEVFSGLGASIASISEDELERDPGSLSKALIGVLDRFSAIQPDTEGLTMAAMGGYLEGGLAQLIAFPELGLTLSGDQAGARAFYTRLKAAGADAASASNKFEHAFAVVVHHLLQGEWRDAVRELAELRRTTGDELPVVQYQLAYLSALCHGRLQDATQQQADLTASRDALDRVRGALRSREMARKLGPVRRAIYEHQLALLFRQKDFTGMELAMVRYKSATVTPIAAVRAAGEAASALGEARHHFDAVSRMTRASQAQIGGANSLALAIVADEAAPGDPGRLTLEALNRAANALLAEAGPPEVARALPRPSAPGELSLSYFVGAKASFVVARLHGGPSQAYRIAAGADELERVALQFRRDIYDRRDVAASANALYRLLIAPVESLNSAELLVIWPDGPLSLLPFQALRRGVTGPYLVQSKSISYITGTRAPARAAGLPAGASGLLVVGNPDGSLDAAENEARQLASVDTLMVGEPLIGAAGTFGNLARRLPAARQVHLATHGMFSEAYPNFSYLVLAGSERLYSLDLGGLDFSGRDIYLSACETRLGVPLPGDDVYGIADAFLSAGAASVVATLWRIESGSSALFAKRYYEQKAAAMSAPEALARTAREFIVQQRWLTQDGRAILLDHPYYWAAYSVVRPAIE